MKKFIIFLLFAVFAVIYWQRFYKNVPVDKKVSNKATEYTDRLQESLKNAEKAATLANTAILKAAIEHYRGLNGRYPESLEELAQAGSIEKIPPGKWMYDSLKGEVICAE